jgi:two-component system sensor histidine kinase BaeS
MRSLTTRFFTALVLVSIAALALGTLWVQRALRAEFGPAVVVERTVETVNGRAVERETRRTLDGLTAAAPAGPADIPRLNRRLVLAVSVVVLGAAAVTGLMARRVLGPIRALREGAAAMAAGRLDARVVVSGRDELAALASAFNEMAAALAVQEQRKRDLTNDIAHELAAPLTDLRCHLEALQDRVVEVTPDSLATLHAEVAHLQRLVTDLGDLARADTHQLRLDPEDVSVGEIVHQLVRQADARVQSLGVRVDVDMPPDGAIVRADRARLRQVLANLFENALAHTPAGGVVTITACAAGGHMVIDVHDTGSGIAPEHAPHVFDRFYRADPSRTRATGGVGLGLAIARRIAEASGGSVSLTSAEGRGSTFSVRWPSAFTGSS